jgi:predicted metal-dependent hydrolase
MTLRGSSSGSNIENLDNETVITMERHSIGEQSPSYSLTILGNGKIVYHGIKNVKVVGTKTAQLSKSEVKELVDEFVNIYYFALKDRYDEASILAMPSVTTSITLDEKTKRIFHNQGSPAPRGLSVLEDKIDKITHANQWTGPQKKKEIS